MTILENADKLKGYPWAEGLVRQAAGWFQQEVLVNSDKLKYYPSLERSVEQAAKRSDSEYIIENADKLWGYSFAEKIVGESAQIQYYDGAGDYAKILSSAGKLKNYFSADDVVKKAAQKAFAEYPSLIMSNIGELKSYSWAESLIKSLVERLSHGVSYELILAVADELKIYSWAENFVKRTAEHMLSVELYKEIVCSAHKITEYGWANKIVEEAVRKAAKDEPSEILKGNLKDYPSVKELVREAVIKVKAQNPDEIILSIHNIVEFFSDEEIEGIFIDDPSGLMRNEKAWPILRSMFKKTHSPKLKPLLNIIDSYYDKPAKARWALLLDIMVKENRSMKEMEGFITYDENRFSRLLLKIKLQPNHLGDRSIDKFLKDSMLPRVWVINDLHDEMDVVRFKSVDGDSTEELYSLMVYGEEEIFTSTFNGLFNRLLQGMEKSNLSGSQLLNNVGYNKFRIFIKLMANYQRLKEFLGTMDEVAQQELLQRFVKNIDQEKDKLAQAVVVADSFGELQDADILKILQTAIKSEYERVKSLKDTESQTIYGLLAGMFGKKAVINEVWLQEMSRQYRLPDLTKVTQAQLFKGGVNIQRYFFYKDKDGEASFESFLSQYRSQANWKVEIDEAGGYVHISSDNQKVEIYANFPSNEDNGQDAIEKVLKQKGLMVSIYVHRGHSYHADNTIERIGSEAAIVFLGSCGGYSNVHEVLSKSPEAHIISTKGTGTMTVNDPLLKMLSERLRPGQDIQWVSFWSDAEERLSWNGNFDNYVAPHKNLGVLFIKAYHRILEKQNTAYQDSLEELNRYASDFVNNPPAVASSSAVKDEKDLGLCLTPDSLISTVSNAGLEGRVIATPLIELREGDKVLSLNEATGKLEPHRVNALLDMGVKPVYRIRTKSGKELKTTLNHPYLTKDGWRKLKDIKTGDEIACLAGSKAVAKDSDLSAINLSAVPDFGDEYFISRQFKDSPVIVNTEAVNFTSSSRKGFGEIHGLRGVKEIFHLFYDPSLNINGKLTQLSFGVGGKLIGNHNPKRFFTTEAGMKPEFLDFSSDLEKTGLNDSISSINLPSSSVNVFGRDHFKDSATLRKSSNFFRSSSGSSGLFNPALNSLGFQAISNFLSWIDSKVMISYSNSSLGWAARIILDKEKNGIVASNCAITPPKLSSSILKLPQDRQLSRLFLPEAEAAQVVDTSLHTDILWDKIVSIDYLGYKYVYDIEVDGTHNFVAQGIVAHNTYQNVGDRKQGTEKEPTASSAISDKGGIDGSASSPLIPQETKAPGGIDFRALPIVTRAMSNLSLNVSRIPLSSIEGINLDQELREIQRLVKAGITPSAERIKEYVQASCLKGNSDMRKVVSCIADILRLEEERCYLTDTMLKDILVVLESGRPVQELKAVFTGANS